MSHISLSHLISDEVYSIYACILGTICHGLHYISEGTSRPNLHEGVGTFSSLKDKVGNILTSCLLRIYIKAFSTFTHVGRGEAVSIIKFADLDLPETLPLSYCQL